MLQKLLCVFILTVFAVAAAPVAVNSRSSFTPLDLPPSVNIGLFSSSGSPVSGHAADCALLLNRAATLAVGSLDAKLNASLPDSEPAYLLPIVFLLALYRWLQPAFRPGHYRP